MGQAKGRRVFQLINGGGIIMAKNKHNRTHTDNQPGKVDYPIADLLPVGKENAISTKALAQLVRCNTVRDLQQCIAKERKAGAVICSSTTGGYYLPANRNETAEFCKSLENRAKNTFIAIQSARRALEMPEGQQVIEGVLENGIQTGTIE